jgi:hypothetical protein
LGHVLTVSLLFHGRRKGKLNFDERSFLVAKTEKFPGAANLPSSAFQSLLLLFVHCALCLSGDFVVLTQPRSASLDYAKRRLASFLAENFDYQDGISISPVYDAPRFVSIHDSQFMTSDSYYRHRPRVR